MQTVIQEIELILNSAPSGVLYDDNMQQILTLNCLLFGRKLNLENVRSDFNLENKVELKKYVNHINNLFTHFWKRWRLECVPSLREYQKVYRRTNNNEPSIGDIVHICEDKQPRQKWLLLGRITKLIKGEYKNLRGAVIFLGRTKRNIERPTNKLYPIEFHDEIENNNVNRGTLRPRREAVIIADLKRKFSC